MAKIQVLGVGCRRCGQLAANAEQAATMFGRNDLVEKITDIARFREFAILALPASAIDGRVVAIGGLPSPEQICKLLEQSEGNPT